MTYANEESPIIKGELAGTHPAKLIFTIAKGKKTGILTFDDSVTKMRLFFKDGCFVDFFDGIKSDKNFRRYLVRNKKVTIDEVKSARTMAKESKKNTIEILIENGILDRFVASSDASDYYWKTVPGAFSWRHGTFTFKEKNLKNLSGDTDLSKTLRLVLDGVINKYNHRMIEQRLKKRMKLKMLVNNTSIISVNDLDLTEDQKVFVDLLIKGNPLITSLGKVNLPHSEAIALAFTLLTFDILKFKSKGKKKYGQKKEKKSALDMAMEAASQSVDKIRERIAEEGDSVSPAVGFKAGAEDDLQAKLEQMYKENGRDAGAEPGGLGLDSDLGSDLGDFESDDNSYSDDDSDFGELDEEQGGEFDYSSDDESGQDLGFGDINDDFKGTVEGDTASFGDLGTYENEPENLTFNPGDSAQDIFKLGITYEEQGAYETAIKAYDEAIQRGLESPEVSCRKGWVIYQADPEAGGFDRGAAIIQEVVKNAPNAFYPYLYLGKIYEAEADTNMAELYYIKALELNRECEDAKNSIKRLFDDK